MSAELERTITEVLLDPRVRERVKPYMQPWMISNTAYQALMVSSLDNDFDNKAPKHNLLTGKIAQKYPNLKADEYGNIRDVLTGYRPIGDADMDAVLNIMESFIRDKLHWRGADQLARGNNDEASRLFASAVNFKLSKDSFVDPSRADVVKTIRDADLPPANGIMKSSLALINDHAQYGGYKYGDLTMVLAPPKVAKTTFMCQEGAHMAMTGYRVAHVWLGDMSEFDGFCKYAAYWSGDDFGTIVKEYDKYRSRYNAYYQNVRMAAYPAYARTGTELVAELRQLKSEFDFDFVVIDYDSNITPESDGMYEAGGLLYGLLKGFAQSERCAVMIGSQPKIAFWQEEMIPGVAAAESSRKQHAIDFMITFGRSPKHKFYGICNVPYIRRGESEVYSYIRYEYPHSKIKLISKATYEREIEQAQAEQGDSLLEAEGESFSDPLEAS